MSHPFAAPAHDVVDHAATVDELEPGLFLDVWFRPRQVVRTVLAHDATYAWWAVAFLVGLGGWNVRGDFLPATYGGILALALVLAVPTGALFVGLYGLTTYVGASMLGDRATVRELAVAVAWGSLPDAMGQIPGLVWLLVAGAAGLEGPAVDAVHVGLMGVALVGWTWSWFTVSHAVGAVLGRSAWRGLVAYVFVGFALTLLGLGAAAMLMVR